MYTDPEYQKKYYENNKERERLAALDRYYKNREVRLAQMKEYYSNHKEQAHLYKIEHYEKNKDKYKKQARESYYRNYDENLKRAKRYREENKDKLLMHERDVTRKTDGWKLRHRVAAHVHRKLTKQPCVICNATEKIQAHHENYKHPLLVTWLCRKHHYELHKIKKMRQHDGVN